MQVLCARAATFDAQEGEYTMRNMQRLHLMLSASAVLKGSKVKEFVFCVGLLDDLCAIMVQEPFKLLIIDSVMANLRTDYSGALHCPNWSKMYCMIQSW